MTVTAPRLPDQTALEVLIHEFGKFSQPPRPTAATLQHMEEGGSELALAVYGGNERFTLFHSIS